MSLQRVCDALIVLVLGLMLGIYVWVQMDFPLWELKAPLSATISAPQSYPNVSSYIQQIPSSPHIVTFKAPMDCKLVRINGLYVQVDPTADNVRILTENVQQVIAYVNKDSPLKLKVDFNEQTGVAIISWNAKRNSVYLDVVSQESCRDVTVTMPD